jgi:hypothetical protein
MKYEEEVEVKFILSSKDVNRIENIQNKEKVGETYGEVLRDVLRQYYKEHYSDDNTKINENSNQKGKKKEDIGVILPPVPPHGPACAPPTNCSHGFKY